MTSQIDIQIDIQIDDQVVANRSGVGHRASTGLILAYRRMGE